MPDPPITSFEVYVAKEDFKFHAAHFVAFEGYRERLHGHNYKAGVRVIGSRTISSDGYVVDFGNIKKVTRKVCKELNERFLCPMLSDVIDIRVEGGNVNLSCQDGSHFAFPEGDCAKLPIVHATAEELAIYLWSKILQGLNAEWLLERGVHTMEVIVAEAPSQEATFRLAIPKEGLGDELLDVRSFIMEGKVRPMPCTSAPAERNRKGGADCENCATCQQNMTTQLQKIADALNARDGKQLAVKDLEEILSGDLSNPTCSGK
jgi:dihydroneopterin triphosphate aldolase (PTPS-III) / 6-pyruvoyltetrahydropterin synthase